MKTRNKVLLLGGVVIFVLFTIFDLQISMFLYNPQSAFGKFIETFGELPMSYVGSFSAAALLVTTEKKVKWKYYLAKVSFGVLLILNSLMASFLVGAHLKFATWIVIVVACIYVVVFYFLAKAVPTKYRLPLRQGAKIGLILSFAAVFIVTIIKMLWGRLRFRSMTDPLSQFSPWYFPQNRTTNNEFMSFPSGHSANSTVIIWLTLLPTFVPALKDKKLVLQIFAAIWIGLVMLSRVIMGAHFATDVSMGMLISLCTFFLLKKVFIKENSLE